MTDIEAELYAAYPVPQFTAPHRPRRRHRVIRPLRGLQGVCLGLILALAYDSAFGLATPIPHMVFYGLAGAWVWPDMSTLRLRAIVARCVACGLVALPFAWWP